MAAEKTVENWDQLIQSGVDFLDRKGKSWSETQKDLLKKFNPPGKDVFSPGATADDKKAFVKNVVEFQKNNHLSMDGKPGAETFRKIEQTTVKDETEKKLTEAEKQTLALWIAQSAVDHVFAKFSEEYKTPDGKAILQFSDTQILKRLLFIRWAPGFNELKTVHYTNISPARQKILDKLVSTYGKGKVDKAINTLLGLFEKHGIATGIVKNGTELWKDVIDIWTSDAESKNKNANSAKPRWKNIAGLGE